jgi:hypothetical protein
MKTQARLCDLTESMDRILRTGRKGEWEFCTPHCSGASRVIRAGSFEVAPDFRNLVILAPKVQLVGDPSPFGRLTIFSTDSDEILKLHCASLITAELETIARGRSSTLVCGRRPDNRSSEPLAVLIARVFCVELKVPSHAISVLARSEVPQGLPLAALLYSLERLGRDPSSRSARNLEPE